MFLILGIAMFVVFVGGVGAAAKSHNRPLRSGGRAGGGAARGGRTSGGRATGGRTGSRTAGGKTTSGKTTGGRTGGRSRRRRGGWVIKAWNASGAPKTSESTLGGVGAVLTGKAAGATARGTVWAGRHASRGTAWAGRRSYRGGRWATNRALGPFDRWLTRTGAGLEAAAALPDRAAADPSPTVAPSAGPGPLTPNPNTRPQPEPVDLSKATTGDILFDPRTRLAFKEKQLADMKTAFEKLRAQGLISPDDEQEHMLSRRRVEGEIERLRRSGNSQPEPARTPPPVFIHPQNPNKGETSMPDTTLNRAAVPSTLAPHLNYIAEFHPENDAELLDLMSAEVQGTLGMAEAVGQMFDNCVTGKGLDPAAMQGVSDYAEAFTEAAERIAAAHRQFISVYEAIIEAANNGTQMPYNGRFFSGEAAA